MGATKSYKLATELPHASRIYKACRAGCRSVEPA